MNASGKSAVAGRGRLSRRRAVRPAALGLGLLAAWLMLTGPLRGGVQHARATEVGNGRPAGLGFSVGEPTGIVGKLFVGPENAWDAGLSLLSYFGQCRVNGKWQGCSNRLNISVNVDFLWQYNLLSGEVKLDWHFGAGGRVWLFSAGEASDFALAARMPLGFDLTFNKPRFLEVFLEFSPAFYILPGFTLDLEPALGVRFYF